MFNSNENRLLGGASPSRDVRSRTSRLTACPGSDIAGQTSGFFPDTSGQYRRGIALILEDDKRISALITRVVESIGLKALTCCTIAEAVAASEKTTFAVILTDDQLPDGRATALLERLDQLGQTAPRIMVTGFPDIARAVSLMRGGLFDYVTKPFDISHLVDTIQRALRHTFSENYGSSGAFVGKSPAAAHVRMLIERAALSPSTTVLVTGETGTGKELTAQLIHDATSRKRKTPLVSIDCAAVPAELFESELFGSERGAYTGAHQARMGLIEAAEGGTLLLDELGEMPLVLQAKLLRFLESREFRRVGSSKTQSFHGRIIAATNRHLPTEVEQGRFRQDLYYRLNVFEIALPSLRDRVDDIPELAGAILSRLADRYERPKPYFADTDLEKLANYHFAGNVRELRNLIEKALVHTPRESHWLHLEVPTCSGTKPENASPAPPSPAAAKVVESPITQLTLEQQEREYLQQALIAESYNITKTAKRLGISRQAVLRRLEKWPELRARAEG